MSIEELKAKAKPRQETARILLDGTMRAAHADLERQLVEANAKAAGQLANPELRKIAGEIIDLEERIVATEEPFVFQSIGTSAWYALIAAHPPAPTDRDVDHDPRTFPIAAIAASCVAPELSVDDASWLRDTLDLGEWMRLWNACLLVNLGEAGRPKSPFASAVLQLNGTSSSTAPLEGSLGASS